MRAPRTWNHHLSHLLTLQRAGRVQPRGCQGLGTPGCRCAVLVVSGGPLRAGHCSAGWPRQGGSHLRLVIHQRAHQLLHTLSLRSRSGAGENEFAWAQRRGSLLATACCRTVQAAAPSSHIRSSRSLTAHWQLVQASDWACAAERSSKNSRATSSFMAAWPAARSAQEDLEDAGCAWTVS